MRLSLAHPPSAGRLHRAPANDPGRVEAWGLVASPSPPGWSCVGGGARAPGSCHGFPTPVTVPGLWPTSGSKDSCGFVKAVACLRGRVSPPGPVPLTCRPSLAQQLLGWAHAPRISHTSPCSAPTAALGDGRWGPSRRGKALASEHSSDPKPALADAESSPPCTLLEESFPRDGTPGGPPSHVSEVSEPVGGRGSPGEGGG